MTLNDVRDVTRLHIAAWEATYRGIVPDEVLDAVDYDDRVRRRRAQLSDPGNPAVNWVLEDEGRVCVWAAVGTPRDDDVGDETAELYAIYARPGETGKGYGRQLMTHALEYARGLGKTDMVLWVLRANARTLRFYAAAGFRPDPRTEPQVDPWFQAEKLRLHRRL